MNFYLTFSDSAKYAEAAKNMALYGQDVIHHSFYSLQTLIDYLPGGSFPAAFSAFNSYLLSLIFKIFQITDLTVMATGMSVFFLSALLLFFIAKRLSMGNTVGLLGCLFFVLNPFFFGYAVNFSTEITFTFEILFFVYLILNKGWLKLFAFIPLIMMLFTRPQSAVIYLSLVISSIYYFIFYVSLSAKHKFTVLLTLFVITFLLAYVYTNGNFKVLLGSYSGSIDVLSGSSLRGVKPVSIKLNALFSKVFYNLYNFLKDTSRLDQTGLLLLYLPSLFISTKKLSHRLIAFFTITVLVLFLITASLTLPNARYIHPIMPLVGLFAIYCFSAIIHQSKIKFPNVVVISVLLLSLIPYAGHFTLDEHFNRQQFNTDKPPVYRVISKKMAQEIPQGKLIVTNLDAWAAWYDNLTTMWFPISPDMLEGVVDNVSYIALTNYKESDSDFALGVWKQLLYTPNNSGIQIINNNFKLLTTFTIDKDEVYENQEYKGVIFVNRELHN